MPSSALDYPEHKNKQHQYADHIPERSILNGIDLGHDKRLNPIHEHKDILPSEIGNHRDVIPPSAGVLVEAFEKEGFELICRDNTSCDLSLTKSYDELLKVVVLLCFYVFI